MAARMKKAPFFMLVLEGLTVRDRTKAYWFTHYDIGRIMRGPVDYPARPVGTIIVTWFLLNSHLAYMSTEWLNL